MVTGVRDDIGHIGRRLRIETAQDDHVGVNRRVVRLHRRHDVTLESDVAALVPQRAEHVHEVTCPSHGGDAHLEP